MTDLRSAAQAIVAETMQGGNSVEAMIDIVYRHLVVLSDEQFKAGYGMAMEKRQGHSSKKVRWTDHG